MAFEHKPNSGSLFRNDRRETEKHPTHTGDALIDGTEYWMSAWVNTSERTGKKYMNVKFRAKDEQSSPRKSAPAPVEDDFDSDVPF